MNVCFVTFMYGLAIPILFVIALFFFCVLYFVERLLLTYYYRKPPMYDEKLNRRALRIIKWTPVVMLLFGYWIMSNKQLFTNEVFPIKKAGDPIVTGHYAFQDVYVD